MYVFMCVSMESQCVRMCECVCETFICVIIMCVYVSMYVFVRGSREGEKKDSC